jgi:hypothetical protein
VSASHLIVASAIALAAGVAPRIAHAQVIDPVTATELFRQGREALAANDVAGACAKFAESARLDGTKIGTLTNLGDCEAMLGQLAKAREHLQIAIDLARVNNDDRLTNVRADFAAIDKRVPRLTLTIAAGAPPSTTVTRDGIALGEASLHAPLPVDPGDHAIVVEAPGFAAKSYTVRLTEGDQRELVVETGPPLPKPPPANEGHREAPIAPRALPKVSATTDRIADTSHASRKPLGPVVFFTAAGATVIAVGATVISGIDAENNPGPAAVLRDCVGQGTSCAEYQKGVSAQTRTNVLLGVSAGLAALTTVIGVFFTEWSAPNDRATASVRVSPSVGVDGVAKVIGLTGSF